MERTVDLMGFLRCLATHQLFSESNEQTAMTLGGREEGKGNESSTQMVSFVSLFFRVLDWMRRFSLTEHLKQQRTYPPEDST